jgi:hypothetical protein
LVRGDISLLTEGAFARRVVSDLRKARRLILEANMQTQPHTQATFTMLVKPHRLIASDRVEQTPVCRSDGTKVGIIERLMIDKVSGRIAYAVLSFGGFMGIGVKHIPIPWDRMKYGVSLDAYEINLNDEELSRDPSFEADKEFDWGYREEVIGNLTSTARRPIEASGAAGKRFGLSVICDRVSALVHDGDKPTSPVPARHDCLFSRAAPKGRSDAIET